MWTVLNAALTIPLVFVAGLLGGDRDSPQRDGRGHVLHVAVSPQLPLIGPAANWWPQAAAAVIVTVLGELTVVYTDVGPLAGLALCGIPAIAGWTIVANSLQRVTFGGLRPAPGLKP